MCTCPASINIYDPHLFLLLMSPLHTEAPWWSNSRPMEVVGGSWAPLGGSGRLECHMKAHPPPTFHWANRDGRTIAPSRKYTFLPSKVSGAGVGSLFFVSLYLFFCFSLIGNISFSLFHYLDLNILSLLFLLLVFLFLFFLLLSKSPLLMYIYFNPFNV